MISNVRKARSIIPKCKVLSPKHKKNRRDEVLNAVLKGFYREKCQEKYDLSLCSWEKEMRKTESMLEHYKKFETTFSDNLKLIIEVFEAILKEKGSSMKPIVLRNFRNNIKKEIDSILSSEEKSFISDFNSEEDIIICNFICEHYYEIELCGFESLMPLLDIFDIRTDSEERALYKKIETIYLRMSSDSNFQKRLF